MIPFPRAGVNRDAELGLAPGPMGRGTVLLAVQDERTRRTLRRTLAGYGYTVCSARDTATAQRLARQRGSIKVLLIDLPAIERGGVLLALWFRAQFPELRVVLASDKLGDLDFGIMRSNRIGLLAKPYTALELAHFIQLVLLEGLNRETRATTTDLDALKPKRRPRVSPPAAG